MQASAAASLAQPEPKLMSRQHQLSKVVRRVYSPPVSTTTTATPFQVKPSNAVTFVAPEAVEKCDELDQNQRLGQNEVGVCGDK